MSIGAGRRAHRPALLYPRLAPIVQFRRPATPFLLRRLTLKSNIATLLLAVVALAYFVYRSASLPWTPIRIAGLAIVVLSLPLFVLARIQLGGAFSVRAKATTLVTTGLYSRIRNPIYVFGGLTIAGFFLWAGKPILLLFFLVLIPLQLRRIRNEERVLEQQFGAAYLQYKQKTWF
ncbi:MAG TPA: isoprenylcysteine carboxylmethyltransferase family protein [Acidobacteriaceae bacterium]|nr:isoprenylcysteine carboxylmethyltransferase family protein [Acidobacteriaceae bacterium]